MPSTPRLPEDPLLANPLLATQLAQALLRRNWRLATAESCTGGLIAAQCTDLSGSSQWFDRGFVTYSNEAKHEMLGVDPTLIAAHGAVSQAVAQAMVQGALQRSHAHVAVAVTGVAGPGGGSANKPVGVVWLAWGLRTQAGTWEEATAGAKATAPRNSNNALGDHAPTVHLQVERMHFAGDRAAVRAATVQHALQGLLALASRT